MSVVSQLDHLGGGAQRTLDTFDPLTYARAKFKLEDGLVYLNGCSLGPPAYESIERVRTLVSDRWSNWLNDGWGKDGWLDLPVVIGEKLAKIVGAERDEVVVADTTSVNLFKLIVGALRLRPGRRKLVTEDTNFPGDLYVAQGALEHCGGQRELKVVPPDELLSSISEDVALVLVSHVDYRSGKIHDIAAISNAAHKRGCLVAVDLCHSAGIIPIELNRWNIDLAVGCGYKYLSGGPGAPAFAYISRRLSKDFKQPITGWIGHSAPFAFESTYRPANGARQLLTGAPHVLSLVALDAAVDLLLEYDMQAIRTKSSALTAAFISGIRELSPKYGVEVVSPYLDADRGGHVAVRHQDARSIISRLAQAKVIAEVRPPDLMRFGFSPLYVRFVDVETSLAQIAEVLRSIGQR